MILNIIDQIGQTLFISKKIYAIIGTIISVMIFHRPIFFVIGMFFTRKFKPAKKNHKYGICIAARNEEAVIGNLIDSIHKQDYPSDLYTIFVVADNCTDKTAEIARSMGAIVYERFDEEHKTKGYALQFLFNQIEKDYKTDSFEGYFIFDADNLLNTNFITKMNDAFDSGVKIVTSYRNSKNFDETWVASNYALHWLMSIRAHHRARSVLRLATNIQGTGFLFSNEIVKDGWKYTSLTEDRALTADAVAQGYQITYQDEAMFYDEQPTDLKIALRQRLRWAKGHLQAFVEVGPYLFLNIFFGKSLLRTKWNHEKEEKQSFIKRLIESIRHRFASFDTLSQLTPFMIVNLIRWLIVMVFIYSCYSYTNGIDNVNLFNGSSWLIKSLNNLTNIKISVSPGVNAFFIASGIQIMLRIIYRIGVYLANMWIAVYLLIVEEKNIKPIPFKNKIKMIIMWPMYDVIERFVKYIAVFKKVTWKPIPHKSKVTIEDLK